jgi:hypothetical protein
MLFGLGRCVELSVECKVEGRGDPLIYGREQGRERSAREKSLHAYGFCGGVLVVCNMTKA